MRKTISLIASLTAGLCLVEAAQAQTAEAALERVAQAYNVEALNSADTLRLESEYRLPFEAHDYSVDFHDLAHQRFHIILDLEGQRGSHEFVTEIAGTSYHGRHLVKDGGETFISYGPDTYTETVESDFLTRFGGTFRSSDVLLAQWLTRDDQDVRYVREATWLGRAHDVVEVDYPNSPPLQIYVRQQDGAITKAERAVSDDQTVFYTFRKHQKQDGIMIAREHSLFVNQESVYLGFNRAIMLDDQNDLTAFDLDPGLELEAERTDQSEMSVRVVGPSDHPAQTVYQVCQGEGCTTFMSVDGELIGFGMSSGLADRLQAYQLHTRSNQPLRYIIAADHHDEDIGGASDATAQGATLLVSDQTARKLQAMDEAHDLEIVSAERNIGDLTVQALSTDHTVSALIAFHETQGLLMQTGHYYSSFVDRPSYARRTATSLYEALPERIKDNATAILSGQDLKAETWADFVSAIEAYDGVGCHHNRRICGDDLS